MDIWPVKTCHLLPKVCGVRKPRGPVNLISNGNSVKTEVVFAGGITRPHCMHSIDVVYCCIQSGMVCICLCLAVSHAEMAEPIEVLYGEQTLAVPGTMY